MNLSNEHEKILMVTPEEYFYNYLTWSVSGVSSSNLSPETVSYESYYSVLDIMLEMQADGGMPGAVQELGERYMYGVDGIKQDIDKAIEYFERAAQMGHPDAYACMSKLYRTNDFGREDMKKYFEYLIKSAQRGSYNSMHNLACAYYKGKEVYGEYGVDQDKVQAIEWEKKTYRMAGGLVKLFNTNPCSKAFKNQVDYILSLFKGAVLSPVKQYLTGDGVPKSKKKAKEIVDEAIEITNDIFGKTPLFLTELREQCKFSLFKKK